MRVGRELLRGDHREDFQGDGVRAESHPRRRLLHAEQVVASRPPVIPDPCGHSEPATGLSRTQEPRKRTRPRSVHVFTYGPLAPSSR